MRCLGTQKLSLRRQRRRRERAAAIYSLLGTAKLNGHNPEAYLREVLARIAEHPITRIDELLSWNLPTPEVAQITQSAEALAGLPA